MLHGANTTANADPDDGGLTYHDAHVVLALLQGWKEGSVSFRHGDLIVDLVLAAGSSTTTPNRQYVPIRSPAVGLLTIATKPGTPLRKGDQIGVIDAPGRSTPIAAPVDGTLVGLNPADGRFVEYDEQIAVLEPAAGE